MQEEIFPSWREFNNKFPTKLYVCSNCNELLTDKYICRKCGWRADGLFQTMGNGYKYTIQSEGLTEEIFKPVELFKKESED